MRIKNEALEFILGVSRKIHPKEFAGLLRGKDDLIEEVILLPGTVFGEGFGTLQLNMLPNDSSVIGSVHSHPSFSAAPSRADLVFFSKIGYIHLIVKRPYSDIDDVSAYGSGGEKVELSVA